MERLFACPNIVDQEVRPWNFWVNLFRMLKAMEMTNIERITKVQCPVFIIHGKKDQEVAFEHGLALQAAVPDECKTDPWWVSNKGHNDVIDGNNIVEYIQRLNRFVRHLDEDDDHDANDVQNS